MTDLLASKERFEQSASELDTMTSHKPSVNKEVHEYLAGLMTNVTGTVEYS